jgi:hypothetical protein
MWLLFSRMQSEFILTTCGQEEVEEALVDLGDRSYLIWTKVFAFWGEAEGRTLLKSL